MFRLEGLVKGRPVGVLLHGASVKELEPVIYHWKPGQWCWVSLNNYPVLEKGILDRIDDRFTMLALFSEMVWKRRQEDMVEFLRRKTDNLLITSHTILDLITDRRNFIREFREKIYLTEGIPVPWPAFRKANSVALLLNELMAADVGPVYIFGMDGVAANSTNTQEKASYYHPEVIFHHKSRQTSVGKDTVDFNKAFPSVVKYWRSEGYAHDVWNCNPNSHITVFSKRTVDSVIQNVLDKG